VHWWGAAAAANLSITINCCCLLLTEVLLSVYNALRLLFLENWSLST
jgi:hypothetical protein